MLTFSIPAHNGGRGPAPEFTRWAGADAARFDLPMSHGVDTRDRAWKVQSTAQELFADAVGAKQTRGARSPRLHADVLRRQRRRACARRGLPRPRRPVGDRRRLGPGLQARRPPRAARRRAVAGIRSGHRLRAQDAHRAQPDLGDLRRVGQDRRRPPAAVLRARGDHERVAAAVIQHRWSAPPVRTRRSRAARPRRAQRLAAARAARRRDPRASGRRRRDDGQTAKREVRRSDSRAHRDGVDRPDRLPGR
jgi:hypothetical protein